MQLPPKHICNVFIMVQLTRSFVFIIGLSLPLDFIIFLLHIRFSAVFESERWKSIMNHPVHTNLEPLLLELPDFCLQSKAVNTRRPYEGAFNKWCKWCVPYSISTLPDTDVNVSLYLMHLSKLKKSIQLLLMKRFRLLIGYIISPASLIHVILSWCLF